MRGSRLPHVQFSLQYLKFSLRYTMGNMFGMFSFAFWVIRALKCGAVNFPKFESAGIPVRPFKYLDAPILIIARAPCMHMHDAHAQCDVTRIICSHCRNTRSSWFASHGDDVGMISSCSHRIHIALMMSSRLGHDVIATHVNHDCSCGT